MSVIQTIEKIKFHITQNNHKLIIILGDKNTHNLLLEKLKSLENIDILNLNLLLSKKLITLSKNEYSNPVEILEDLFIENSTKDVILLSYINILFDVNLKWNPLDIFKKLSLNRTVVVLWDGKLNERGLEYASPQHLEYRQYSISDLNEILIIDQ
jgi:hypothetical protein